LFDSCIDEEEEEIGGGLLLGVTCSRRDWL